MAERVGRLRRAGTERIILNAGLEIHCWEQHKDPRVKGIGRRLQLPELVKMREGGSW